MLESLICGAIIFAAIEVKDIENDGTHTHLLRAEIVPGKPCPNQKIIVETHQNPIYISYNAPIALGKEGEYVSVKIDAECSVAFGVDEKMSDKLNQWISYRSWICTATKLETIP
jgi:hypothetical protein